MLWVVHRQVRGVRQHLKNHILWVSTVSPLYTNTLLYPVLAGTFFISAVLSSYAHEYFLGKKDFLPPQVLTYHTAVTIICVIFMIMRVLKTSGENLHFLRARQFAILVS